MTSHSIERAAATGHVKKTGNTMIDGVLSGYEWKSTSLTFAFATDSSQYAYEAPEVSGVTSSHGNLKLAVRNVLFGFQSGTADDAFSISGFLNVGFTETNSDVPNADLKFARSTSADTSGHSYYPSAPASKDDGQSGDVFFGNDLAHAGANDPPLIGDYGYQIILREIGHALGLKDGNNAIKADRIKTELKGQYDSHEYSVMTYHSYAGAKKADYTNEDHGYAQTYMMADIAALQHLYGADYGANSGDTVYKWSPSNGVTLVNGAAGISPNSTKIFATIWDGSGVDTYDLSDYTSRVIIDLRPGKYSDFGAAQRVDLGKSHLAHGNIYNALLFEKNKASLIEDAIGGSAGDKLTGNTGNNTLTGGGGNDQFVFQKGSNRDTITDFESGFDRINVASFDIKNFSTLKHKMSEDGADVVINFGHGDKLTLTTHTITDLDKHDFIL